MPEPPAEPSDLQAFALSSSEIELTWQDNADNETGFTVMMSDTTVTTLATDALSYTVTALEPETEYCFTVSAFNDDGESTVSNTACAITLGEPPAAPGNVQATALSSSEIELTWGDLATNENGYQVVEGDFTLAELPADTTFHLVDNLQPDTFYCFSVAAYNDAGQSDLVEACATTMSASSAAADDIGFAPLIDLPFTATEDVTGATADPTDPVISCTGQQHYNTVWYLVYPFEAGQLTVDTYGSDYDTVLAVWEDTGSLLEVGCNDDADSNAGITQSELSIPVNADTSYFIEVAAYGEDTASKTLNIQVSHTP
jgi:hypothetical protein